MIPVGWTGWVMAGVLFAVVVGIILVEWIYDPSKGWHDPWWREDLDAEDRP